MDTDRMTLSAFLASPAQGLPAGSGLPELLATLAATAAELSALVGQGALSGLTGKLADTNFGGEQQTPLDVLSNQRFTHALEQSGRVAGLVSEEMDDIYPVTGSGGEFLVMFDPLDGSSNVDINMTSGAIFSVLPAPSGREPQFADYLQPGSRQLAAGYALYGPATLLVLTVGCGTHGFTLDRARGEFVLTHPGMAVPEDTCNFSINASNERFWQPPVKKYINECRAGRYALRGKDFNMRWMGAMVAEVHRILLSGGIYLYPQDSRDEARPGRLRLLYEANPMALLIEQAGGLASTGRTRMLEVVPEGIHQLVSVVLGSRHEVERVARYHAEYDSGLAHEELSPLFNDRSFYR